MRHSARPNLERNLPSPLLAPGACRHWRRTPSVERLHDLLRDLPPTFERLPEPHPSNLPLPAPGTGDAQLFSIYRFIHDEVAPSLNESPPTYCHPTTSLHDYDYLPKYSPTIASLPYATLRSKPTHASTSLNAPSNLWIDAKTSSTFHDYVSQDPKSCPPQPRAMSLFVRATKPNLSHVTLRPPTISTMPQSNDSPLYKGELGGTNIAPFASASATSSSPGSALPPTITRPKLPALSIVLTKLQSLRRFTLPVSRPSRTTESVGLDIGGRIHPRPFKFKPWSFLTPPKTGFKSSHTDLPPLSPKSRSPSQYHYIHTTRQTTSKMMEPESNAYTPSHTSQSRSTHGTSARPIMVDDLESPAPPMAALAIPATQGDQSISRQTSFGRASIEVSKCASRSTYSSLFDWS